MRAARLGALQRDFGLDLVPPAGLVRLHIAVVALSAPTPLIWACRLARVAVLAELHGAPTPLPSWQRRVQRFICADQDTARAWHRSGIALGRIVVVQPGPFEAEAFAAVLTEVHSMRS